jgi:hypothetical protein
MENLADHVELFVTLHRKVTNGTPLTAEERSRYEALRKELQVAMSGTPAPGTK